MKKYSPEEISSTREYFRKQRYPEIQANVGNINFSYFLLPQQLEPNLKDFVFRCTGDSPDEYVVGISDSVKEEFRPYAVAHELIEFLKIGIDQPNRCVRALEEEVAHVPVAIKPEYLQMRRNFFRNLLVYAAQQPENFSQHDLAEFDQSLSRLEKLVKA